MLSRLEACNTMLQQILDIFLHLDKHLGELISSHGAWVYAITFAIIFAETGLVLLPFLPGDSLLFALGALSVSAPLDQLIVGTGADARLNVWWVIGLLVIAGIIGDAVNYHIGKYVGPRVFRGEGVGFWGKLLNKKHLNRAHEFYEKYGGKAVVLGRFVPIVRTFVPFVAGAGAMTYRTFVLYNVLGALLWVGVCVLAGFWFGGFEIVKKNFELVVVGIIIVSLIPIAIELLMSRRKSAAMATQGAR